MLNINPSTPKIIKAKRDFRLEMCKFILKRFSSLLKNNKININLEIVNRLFQLHIIPNIEDILIGEPENIIKISNSLNTFFDYIPDFKKAVEYVFDYKIFTQHTISRFDAYSLAELLDIRTCVYCNRNYTTTVITRNGTKLTRPQFDHYFDKGRHPILSVSFYNLIPSCSICNSNIKGTHKMDLNNYVHPYRENASKDIQFSYKYSNQTKSGIKISVKGKTAQAQNTIDVFALDEIYNSHAGELLDLLRTKQYYSDRYLSILATNLLKDVILSKEDIYRMIFGTEYREENFVNRPFSKFKSDILREIGIIP